MKRLMASIADHIFRRNESGCLCAHCGVGVSYRKTKWVTRVGSVCPQCAEELPAMRVLCGICWKEMLFVDGHEHERWNRICDSCAERLENDKRLEGVKERVKQDKENEKQIRGIIKKARCPKCGSSAIQLIMYGLVIPSPNLNKLIKEKLVAGGGCGVRPFDRRCRRCGHEYSS